MNDYQFLLDFISSNKTREFTFVPNYGITYNEPKFKCKWKNIHEFFSPITDYEIQRLEEKMNVSIPLEYKYFLENVSNGLHLYLTSFCLDGKRTHYDRIRFAPQPFDIITKNTLERPKNATADMLFIGGYDWDGSCLYIDNSDGSVHLCKEWDTTSLKRWDSFYNMISSEVKRLKDLYGENGEKYSDDICSLPLPTT